MPRYRYLCDDCRNTTEVDRTIKDRHDCPHCEMCGSETKKLMDSPALDTYYPGSHRNTYGKNGPLGGRG